MINLRTRLLVGTDRLLAALVSILLVGTTMAFGGAVGWARLAIALVTTLLVLTWLARVLLEGTWRVLKSPLAPLGMLALLLAAAQLAPMPAALAGRFSSQSRAVHTLGAPTSLVRADDPSLELPKPPEVRSPITVDRSATLRWLAGASACLAVFGVVAQFVDRLGHLLVIWGSIVAAFSLNTTVGLVQLAGGSGGLYGAIEPGRGPSWGPSLNDLLESPNATVLRLAAPGPKARDPWAVPRPDRPFAIGSLMGGPGAYLALGSIALPLALAMALQLLAPRGSRESAWDRLRHSGKGGLLVLLIALLVAGAAMAGAMAGPWLCLPIAFGLLLAGLPGAWPSGLRWVAVATTLVVMLAMGLGATLGHGDGPLAARADWTLGTRVWADSSRIARDFPVLGTGLGSFASIYPSYKSRDQATTTALSSLFQWWVEAGAAGMALLAVGGLWCVARLPGAIRRVGTADRALAFGLVGAAVSFALFSVMHWTIELPAVALAAVALAGTCDRWLAGGTDLFVERG